MDNFQKHAIKIAVDKYVSRFPSQKKAVAPLNGVSEGVLIDIRKTRWESISDQMWRKVSKQIGYKFGATWNAASTNNFNAFIAWMSDAKNHQNTYAITAPAGSGKTFAAKNFASNNQNVIYIQCSEYLNRKSFLLKILQAMGVSANGNVSHLMDTIIDSLTRSDSPIILFDEFDKLTDQVTYFFITLYNELSDRCAFIMLGTNYLSDRITKGKNSNKKGYTEIFSRIGRKFLERPKVTASDVKAVCMANGIENEQQIIEIANGSEGDLRRVEREVHKWKVNGGFNDSKAA